MKNSYFKLILIFYLMSLIIILAMGFTTTLVFSTEPNFLIIKDKIEIITFTTIFILSVISIIYGIITYKKMIEPMSRMLKSANPYEELDNITGDNDEISNMIIDISNNLKNENRQQKLQTDTILNHMTDGVVAFDMLGAITYINPAAKTMLELDEKDNTFNKIFSRYDDDINMEKAIYLEDWTSTERMIENDHGSMHLLFVPFKDNMKRPTGVMAVIQDITKQVKLDNMTKEFVADVSHELKTPLTSIKGFSETLLDGECDRETEIHFLNIINDNADRMEKLVQDLLMLSKYDNKNNQYNPTQFDLGELSKKCAEKFEIEVKKKNQKMECLVTADVPLVYADKEGIERVIINIISNSVKYTGENGRIDIFVGFVHNDAYVKIKDNGIGIPQEDLNRIYERFYRVDKARTRKSGGNGLGLSIAKEIIERNNGSIDIKSQSGKGTEVILKIPVTKGKKKGEK